VTPSQQYRLVLTCEALGGATLLRYETAGDTLRAVVRTHRGHVVVIVVEGE